MRGEGINKIRFFMLWFLVCLFVVLFCAHVRSEPYDALVQTIKKADTGAQAKAKDELVRVLKDRYLKSKLIHGPDQFTENTFCFGHFINPKTLDLAVGISTPPYGGNLIILTEREKHYVAEEPLSGIAFIESMEAVNLFPGNLNQLSLNLYTGGSDWRHWGNDVYRWDGRVMRLIWAWVRKDIRKKWSLHSRSEITGGMVQSEISFGALNSAGIKAINVSNIIEQGVFGHRNWELSKVTSQYQTKMIFRWDEALFYYIDRYGIIVSDINVQCKKGIPQKEDSMTLSKGQRVGIVEIPDYRKSQIETYHAVIGKEHFCEIPATAMQVISSSVP